MARAKRTDRAAARRRYRAELQAEDELAAGADGGTSPSSAPAKAGTTSRSSTAPASQRIGIGTAFRLAFRPLDLRSDLRTLPDVAVHSKALWVPCLLVIGSTAFVAITGIQNLVASFMFAYFIQMPAIGGAFLAGFLAPRSSWLLGAIVGLVAAIGFSFLILAVPLQLATQPPTPAEAQSAITTAFIFSPIMGAFFAAAAAWYRRFLLYTNPNRNRAAASKTPKADGRSRTSGAQKADAARR